MNRKMLSAALALALGWAGGAAQAQDADKAPVSGAVIVTNSNKISTDVMADLTCNDHAHGRFIADGAIFFIQPTFETNPAFGVARQNISAGSALFGIEQHDFRYGLDAAWQFSLGYISDSGLGMRSRYFSYAHSAAETAVPPTAGPGELVSVFPAGFGSSFFGGGIFFGSLTDLRAYSDLRVNVLDLEVTQEWRPGRWFLTGAAGVRYAHMSQDSLILFTTEGEIGDNEAVFAAHHNFNGAGPLVGLDARRTLGNSGLGLYSNARAAILFGTAKESHAAELTGGFDGGVNTRTEITSRQTDVLPILEMEMGVEYGKNIGRVRLFTQVGFFGQVWFGGGNATLTSSIISQGFDSSTNFGFVGGTVRAGVEF